MPSDGEQVSVHYHGTLDDGSVFDSSRQREPLTFVLGAGQVIPGFEEAAKTLTVGESVTVRLEPEQAYGESTAELVFTVPAAQVAERLEVGDYVELANGGVALVTESTDEHVTVDANHPLAGQALTFEIQLVAVG